MWNSEPNEFFDITCMKAFHYNNGNHKSNVNNVMFVYLHLLKKNDSFAYNCAVAVI